MPAISDIGFIKIAKSPTAYVAIGNYNNVAYRVRSTDGGTTWSEPIAFAYTHGVYDICYVNGYFCVVGYYSSAADNYGVSYLYSTNDGQSFYSTAPTDPASGKNSFNCMVYGENMLVCLGRSTYGTLYTGTLTQLNGANWQLYDTRQVISALDVAYGPDMTYKFAIACSNGTMCYANTADDLKTALKATYVGHYGSASKTITWRSIAYNNGKYVCIGYQGTSEALAPARFIITSTDGETWSEPKQFEASIVISDKTLNKFIAIDSLITGVSSIAMTSEDGETWSERVHLVSNGLAICGIRDAIVI